MRTEKLESVSDESYCAWPGEGSRAGSRTGFKGAALPMGTTALLTGP